MASDAFTWAGRIRASAAAGLGGLRLIHGLEGALVNDELWVRGPRLKPADEEMACRVPWEERYEIIEGNHLRREGRHLPEGTLPNGSWVRLSTLLRARQPTPVVTGDRPRGIAVELREGATTGEPNLLESATKDWMAYAETAPEIRLRHLAFALNENDPERLFIRGVPLPPLPGERFVEANHIATAAGYHWYPPVSAGSVRMALGVAEKEFVVLRTDASWSRIPRSAWVNATRSTIRLMLSPERYA